LVIKRTREESTSRSSWGSIDSQVHVANNSGRKLYVIVTPKSEWAWADVGTMLGTIVIGAAFTAVTAGAGAPAEATLVAESATQLGNLAKGINSIKKAYDLISEYTLFKAAMSLYKANAYFKRVATPAIAAEATALETNVNNIVLKLKEFLQKSAIAIDAGDFKRVNDTSYLKVWNALNPSYWGALSGCQTVQVLIIDDSMERTCSFSTGADDSWIVTPDRIVRSKYGTIWQQDPSAGCHFWNNAVVIYMDGSYQGPSQNLVAGRYNTAQLTIGDNQLSSLRIPSGWKVTLYKEPNFAGTNKVVLTADTPYVGDAFNDSVSSIVVESPINKASPAKGA
jgi:hypothetical protein